MKNKIYFFLIFVLLFGIFISQSSDIIKEVFPFYPYNDTMVKNFEEFCLKMKLKKDCMIENAKKMNKEEIYDIKQDISFSFLDLLTYIINNIQIYTEVKKWLNEKNERIILKIEKFLDNSKYQDLVDRNFQNDIDALIEESISQLNRNKNIDSYIEDFFNQLKIDNNYYLNSKFKGDISSLNFFVLGETNVKTKFIETILEKKNKR